MLDHHLSYINGQWISPRANQKSFTRYNPATQEPLSTTTFCTEAGVDNAVNAARAAFEDYSKTSVAHRIALLDRIIEVYQRRAEDFAQAVMAELGAPISFCRVAHVPSGLQHFKVAREILNTYPFETSLGNARIWKEPIGVCGLITPWNWPLNQVTCKVAPALAAGCTVILKPSELTPRCATLLAEVLHEAGVPAGVFNLVLGDGPRVGRHLALHPGIDMVSFTGSTTSGKSVAQLAAQTVKRVTLELGGKSANIILPDADLERTIQHAVSACFKNSGQSCNAPTRLLVPHQHLTVVEEIAAKVARDIIVGAPSDAATQLGPLVSASQFERVQHYIRSGLEQGARLLVGGPGIPQGLERGYFVKSTIFTEVTPEMSIASEEIFGPVLSIIPYASLADAIHTANQTRFGLASYLWGSDKKTLNSVAKQLRTGMVHINGAPLDFLAPFGGYRESGNGREYGLYGFEEYLETKSVMGG